MKPTGPFLEVLSGPDDRDAEVEQVLGAARTWAEPSRENRERVAAALRGALPGLPAASGLSSALWPGSPAAPDAKLTRAGRAARFGRAPLAIIGGALIGVLGFWLGHGAGYAAGVRDVVARAGELHAGELHAGEAPPGAAGGALAAGNEAAREMESPAPERAASAAPPLERPSAPRAPAPLASAPSERATSAAPARVHRAAPPAARARGAAPSAEHSDVAEPPRLSFRQVLDQLRRAQQQLRNGQATMSLLLLSELDRAAGDVLLEERDATRVLALCAVGQDQAARDVARRLEHDSPRSIYGMRLETSCASEPSE